MYDLHALLDFLTVECAATGTAQAKRIRVPYKHIIKPEPRFMQSELVIELAIYWDGDTNGTEPSSEQTFTFTNADKGRH